MGSWGPAHGAPPFLSTREGQPGFLSVSALIAVHHILWGWQERILSPSRLVSLDCAPLRVKAPGRLVPYHEVVAVLPRTADESSAGAEAGGCGP